MMNPEYMEGENPGVYGGYEGGAMGTAFGPEGSGFEQGSLQAG
jgi:hypothetical protein